MSDPRKIWLSDASAETTESATSSTTLSKEEADSVYRSAVEALTQALVPHRPSPNELQDKLPQVAMALYEGVEAGLISEEDFWQIIRNYAASIGEMRVRSMLANTVRWTVPPSSSRRGRFSLFGTIGLESK